jgi:hypothetical protein
MRTVMAMGKSDLTLAIENALKWYRPNSMGGYELKRKYNRYMAFEVPVVCNTSHGGLIDAVEIAEHVKQLPSKPTCRWSMYSHWRKHFAEMEEVSQQCIRKNKQADKDCNATDCQWNRLLYQAKDEVMIICYEIKTSLSDFRSKNGHNFVGNMNFYVIPCDLYVSVKRCVPDDIGVILYDEQGAQRNRRVMRRKKDCEFKDIGHEAQKWLMFSVFKKNIGHDLFVAEGEENEQ